MFFLPRSLGHDFFFLLVRRGSLGRGHPPPPPFGRRVRPLFFVLCACALRPCEEDCYIMLMTLGGVITKATCMRGAVSAALACCDMGCECRLCTECMGSGQEWTDQIWSKYPTPRLVGYPSPPFSLARLLALAIEMPPMLNRRLLMTKERYMHRLLPPCSFSSSSSSSPSPLPPPPPRAGAITGGDIVHSCHRHWPKSDSNSELSARHAMSCQDWPDQCMSERGCQNVPVAEATLT